MRLKTDECSVVSSEWQQLSNHSLSGEQSQINVCTENSYFESPDSDCRAMELDIQKSVTVTNDIRSNNKGHSSLGKRKSVCNDPAEFGKDTAQWYRTSKSTVIDVDVNSYLIENDDWKSNTSTSGIVYKNNFATLPDEVILMIFKYFSKPNLVKCACVCRRWRSIAFDNDLWPRIDLSQRKISPGIMGVILHRRPITLRMSQTEVHTPLFYELSETTDNIVSKMEYLDLSMATILLHDLELLLRTCHSLFKLSLEFCEVNETICKEIAKNSKLTVLNMSQCPGVNEDGLKFILTNCKRLIELNIAWTGLNAACIKCISQYLTRDMLELNLSGCLEELHDSHVATLVMRCNKLQELDLSDAGIITHKSVLAIFMNLKQLQVLSMSRCYRICPAIYSKLLLLPSLTHLNVFGIFDNSQIEEFRKAHSIKINQMKVSFIARPTVGDRRSSIWCMPVRD